MPEHTNATRPELLSLDRFTRSSKYDPTWVMTHEMGPNVLWLTEFLCDAMEMRPGMRVLDLGCGKGLSAIFRSASVRIRG